MEKDPKDGKAGAPTVGVAGLGEGEGLGFGAGFAVGGDVVGVGVVAAGGVVVLEGAVTTGVLGVLGPAARSLLDMALTSS